LVSFFAVVPRPPRSPLFPYTTLFRSQGGTDPRTTPMRPPLRVARGHPVTFGDSATPRSRRPRLHQRYRCPAGYSGSPRQPRLTSTAADALEAAPGARAIGDSGRDRKSTRLNSSHV